MRAGLLVEGLARATDLSVAVVPVAAPTSEDDSLSWTAERARDCWLQPLPSPRDAAKGWVEGAGGRELLAGGLRLPERARLASPLLGASILERAPGQPEVVYLMRSYLGGLVPGIRSAGGRARFVLDVDEDDAKTLRSISEMQRMREETDPAAHSEKESEAYASWLARCLPLFDRVLVASETERQSLLRRHAHPDLRILPNAVSIGTRGEHASSPDGPPRLLFVGNLDYAPNRDAVERLTRELFPRIRRELPAVELHLVGGGERPPEGAGVHAHGAVPDLEPHYARATLTLIPLRAGGGSRIKLLEAFAQGIPVVATPTAAEGLEVRSGQHLLLAERDDELVVAATRLLRDPRQATALASEARTFVEAHHDLDRVAETLATSAVP